MHFFCRPNRDSAGKLRKESCSETFDKDVVNKTKSGGRLSQESHVV